MALLSAVFTSWAWSQRSDSENWAFMGFFFFSLPTIITTILMAISLIIGGRRKEILIIRNSEISFTLLILFLMLQAVMGYFSAK